MVNIFKSNHKSYRTAREIKYRTKNINNRIYDEYPTIDPTDRDFDPLYTSFKKFTTNNMM